MIPVMKALKPAYILLSVLLLIAISGTFAAAEYHHIEGCDVCHYAAWQEVVEEAQTCLGCGNDAVVRCVIETPDSGNREVTFPPYVRGTPLYDGVCEVCHKLWDGETGTKYYTNDGSGEPHREYQPGLGGPEDCMVCHKHAPYEFGHEATIGSGCDPCHGHDEGYVYAADEAPCEGDGTYESHSAHMEDDGDDLKGPNLKTLDDDLHGDCGACHDTQNFPLFGDDGDAETLDATGVCDNCHSPGGAYDGVAMAKASWETGVYDSQFEVLPYWQGETHYETGDIVLYEPDAVTQAYVALHTFTSEPDTPKGSNWKLIDSWASSVSYQCGDLVLYNGKVWRSRFTHVSGASVTPNHWELVQRTGAGEETLLPGKEKWCAGCHDDEPANSKKDDSGVYAPNVLGDNTTYGFYVSGHGRAEISSIGMAGIGKECLDCHNSTFAHIDDNHRTYEIDEQAWPYSVIHAYKDSYRLKENMVIPRGDEESIDDAFPLCMDTCHDAHPYVFSELQYRLTNFRKTTTMQYHKHHLDDIIVWYDSDWDSDTDHLDSNISCPACHNVHGSPMDLDRTEEGTDYQPNPVMTRHGELISTPGTEDKVPAIDHCWLTHPLQEPTNKLSDSWRGTGDVYSTASLCDAGSCHVGGQEYDRTPGGENAEIVDMQVWTTDAGNNEQTEFYPGEPIHYHLSFYLIGPMTDEPWCVKTEEGESGAFHLPYPSGWVTPIVMEETILSRGKHTMCWDLLGEDPMTIPSDAEEGDARFRMKLLMRAPDCSSLLDSDIQTYDFTVVEEQP